MRLGIELIAGQLHSIKIDCNRVHRIYYCRAWSDLPAARSYGCGAKGDRSADRCGYDGYRGVSHRPPPRAHGQ